MLANKNTNKTLATCFLLTAIGGCTMFPPLVQTVKTEPAEIHVSVNLTLESSNNENNSVPAVQKTTTTIKEPSATKIITEKEIVKVPMPLCEPMSELYHYKKFEYTPSDKMDKEELVNFAATVMAWVNGVENLLVEARINADCYR